MIGKHLQVFFLKRSRAIVVDVMPWLPIFLFDDRCVALWALMHFAMIPVADATGRDISPSGLRGVSEVEHASVRHTGAQSCAKKRHIASCLTAPNWGIRQRMLAKAERSTLLPAIDKLTAYELSIWLPERCSLIFFTPLTITFYSMNPHGQTNDCQRRCRFQNSPHASRLQRAA